MQTYSDFFKTLHDETNPTGYLGRGTHYSVLRAVVFHDPIGTPLPEGDFTDFAVVWDEDHDLRVIEPIEEIYRRGLLSSFLIFGERKGSFTAIQSDKILRAIPFNPAFLRRVDELQISGRAANGLACDNVVYIGDLVQKTEAEMEHIPNFGRFSLREIKGLLAQMGLHLGMAVPGWPPKNIESLVKDEKHLEEHKKRLETEINEICQSLNDPWTSTVVAFGSGSNPIIQDEDGKVNLYLQNLKMLWQLGIATRLYDPTRLAIEGAPRGEDLMSGGTSRLIRSGTLPRSSNPSTAVPSDS
jgi:hypothetical protein